MDAELVIRQLEAAKSARDFNAASAEIVDGWLIAGAGSEFVEPALRFMELNPDLDFGMPGAIVHFVERFYGDGYEELLLASLARRPTEATTWMLNRVLNGTRDPVLRRRYVEALQEAAAHAMVDRRTQDQVRRFLRRV